MNPEWISRLEKERNIEVTDISQALADLISTPRNGIEIHYGSIKNCFSMLSNAKGKKVFTAEARWVHSTVANCFALENIHSHPECFPDLPETADHPFFEVDNLEEDEDALTQLLEEEDPTEREANLINSISRRHEALRQHMQHLGILSREEGTQEESDIQNTSPQRAHDAEVVDEEMSVSQDERVKDFTSSKKRKRDQEEENNDLPLKKPKKSKKSEKSTSDFWAEVEAQLFQNAPEFLAAVQSLPAQRSRTPKKKFNL